MKIRYNSPVILTFALISAGLLVVDQFIGMRLTRALFSLNQEFRFTNPFDYLRLFTHVAGHMNWPHLLGNFALILLIGPILEEKYGSSAILEMILVTALATGVLNHLFFDTGLLGASGIVFMLILLSSFTNIRSGEIPLTFILVAVLYLTREITGIFMDDRISQFAHILGGICGAGFGFLYCSEKSLEQKVL